MPSLPPLPPRVEHRIAKAACGLPPRLQRLLFGAPPSLDGNTLAPDIQVLLRLLAAGGNKSLIGSRPVEEARAANRQGAATVASQPPIPMARVEAVEIPGPAGSLAARLYVPDGLDAASPAPLLLFFHGGGWVLCDLDTHDDVCRFLATAAGVAVLSADYRRAPEHPFPAAIEDALAAFSWTAENAGALGADPSRFAIGGDSAGGNLAASVSLLARDAGGPTPAMQLLLYPTTDGVGGQRSRELFAEGFFLTKADIDRCEAAYLPEGSERDDPRVSVLRAPDLSNLPPAYVATGGFDPLRDEGEAYAQRMQEAGVKVALRRHPHLIHGFANTTSVSRSGRAAMLEAAGALRMGLANGSA
jgi:acetyl esterase